MLQNGLGKLISEVAPKHDRIVDLFCGSASVSWYAATKCDHPVVSVDLQTFAITLAGAVIRRTKGVSVEALIEGWVAEAITFAENSSLWREAKKIDNAGWNTVTWSKRSRAFCDTIANDSGLVLCRTYGGHYFSPTQAILLDALLGTVPRSDKREVCVSAVIIAASQCAASPGHTAQPFQPTRTAAMFLREAWLRDPIVYVKRALMTICPLYAKQKGTTLVGDAVDFARQCNRTDFVFVDPPYSAVHYSRFYHVLETIARGKCGEVSGIGRYPPPSERPASAFSRKGEANSAIQELLEALADAQSSVAITFPEGKCSNGLSGIEIAELAKKWFRIDHYGIKSRFSTLGGNNENRNARQVSNELILLLRPKLIQKRH